MEVSAPKINLSSDVPSGGFYSPSPPVNCLGVVQGDFYGDKLPKPGSGTSLTPPVFILPEQESIYTQRNHLPHISRSDFWGYLPLVFQ